MQEFKDEKIGLKATFDNFLKLPLAGKLDRANGNITNTRSSGRYWTSALVYDPKPEFITVTYHHWYNLWIATHDRIAIILTAYICLRTYKVNIFILIMF
jgi:hypothetical protein